MFGYVYLTENLINGKCYIGQRRKSTFDTKYLGSGKYLQKAIKKYGKNNFICQPIQWCETYEELNEAERYWIAKCNAVDSDDFYNIAYGGVAANGGHKGHPHSEETKQLLREISQNHKLTPEQKLKQHLSMMGHNITDECRRKISEKTKGKKLGNKNAAGPHNVSEEGREKMRLSKLGRHWKLVNGKRVYYD